jgi:hypothetical protein
VGIVWYRLCAGRFMASQIVPPYFSQLTLSMSRNEFKRHLVVAATQVQKNMVSAGRLCASLHHIQKFFSADRDRRASGRWVSSVPWQGWIAGIGGACHCSRSRQEFASNCDCSHHLKVNVDLETFPCAGVDIFGKSLVGDDWSNSRSRLVLPMYAMTYVVLGMSLLEDDWIKLHRYAVAIHQNKHKTPRLHTQQHSYMRPLMTAASNYYIPQVRAS